MNQHHARRYFNARNREAILDTSAGFSRAGVFNGWSTDKSYENGYVSYMWGADTASTLTNTTTNLTAPIPWHEYYTPWTRNATATLVGNSGDNGLTWFQANHADWLMYKSDGTTLSKYGSDPNVVLDYANTAVQDWVLNTYWKPALAGGFNGISIDNSLNNNIANLYGHKVSGSIVQQYDSRSSGTRRQYTYNSTTYAHEQSKALQRMVVIAKATYPLATFTVNQPWDNFGGWSEILTSGATAILDEQCMFLGNNFTTAYGTETYCTTQTDFNRTDAGNTWLLSMTAYRDMQRNQGMGLRMLNEPPYSVAANSSTGGSYQRDDVQWSLANYLLVRYANTYLYHGSYNQYGTHPSLWDQPEYATVGGVGRATNDFYSVSGDVYARDFVNGKAFVNASGTVTTSVTLPTGAGYKDLYGTAISSPRSMTPHSGWVVLYS